MTSSLSALKRSNNLDTLMGELSKVAEPQKQSNSYQDDRFWKPELDKTGNGYAVLRFLTCSLKSEEMPLAKSMVTRISRQRRLVTLKIQFNNS